MGSKIKNITVTHIVDGKRKEWTVRSKMRPRRTEVGPYFLSYVNALGIACIQKNHSGITSSEEWAADIATHYGIVKGGMDLLGKYTDEWEVTVDGEAFVGDLKEKETTEEPVSVEAPEPAQASADKTDDKDTVNIGKLIKALNDGKHEDNKIYGVLMKSVGKEKADTLWKTAKTQMMAPPKVEAPVVETPKVDAPAELSF